MDEGAVRSCLLATATCAFEKSDYVSALSLSFIPDRTFFHPSPTCTSLGHAGLQLSKHREESSPSA